MEGDVLRDSDDSRFDIHESKSYANTVPRSIPKGHGYVRQKVVFVSLTEPVGEIIEEISNI